MRGRTIKLLATATLLLFCGSGSTHPRGAAGLRNQKQDQMSQGARLRMDMASYDFGNVARRGGDLTHDFVVRNDGTAPLVVTRVITSCSCLKASFSKRPLPAGGQEVIRITYEPHKSDPGVFHKVIQVYSNSIDGRQLITVRGNSLDAAKK